jgi:predicted DNA binding CopG/RHH family protein
MKLLLGLVVDASKLQNPVVQAVQAETASKIQTIQSSIDELLKLRVEQFMALSTKAHGVDGATLNKICHEAIQELATRHGLTDEQRAMLSRVMVQLHENDFARDLDAPKKTPDQLDGEKASQKDVKPPEAKVLSKQELEKLFREELVQLEEFLKERDEVKLKRAQEKLEALLEEASEEGMEYVIDEDYEVIKTFTLRGVVRHEKTKEPIPFAHIYAGILGTLITDGDGLFTFLNVPQDTAYMIGVDKIGMKFAPEFVTGSMTTSVDIAFLGEELI